MTEPVRQPLVLVADDDGDNERYIYAVARKVDEQPGSISGFVLADTNNDDNKHSYGFPDADSNRLSNSFGDSNGDENYDADSIGDRL